MKIVGEIPARGGSKRVHRKNLRPLDGKPLIHYAIAAAKAARTLTDVYVNSDDEAIGQVGADAGIQFYLRPAALGSDDTLQDEYNYDFIKAVGADILVQINPVCPLIDGADIDAMVRDFQERDLDTLIAVRDEQAAALVGDRPVNFELNERLRRTQDLPPLRVLAWSIAIWKASTFIRQFDERGYAAFCGKVGYYPLDRFKAHKISTEEDFVLAEILIRNMHRWKFAAVPYDSEQLGSDYPAMWLSEIRHIERLLEETAARAGRLNVLEWGAGRSTIYFSKHLKQKGIDFRWLAIENYIPWYDEVLGLMKGNEVSDTTRCVLMNGTCEERKYLQEERDLSDYVNYPATLGETFDLILVDGRRRAQCLAVASRIVSPPGVVVVHDAERLASTPVLAAFDGGGVFVCENRSPVPGGVQRLWTGRISRQAVA